MNDLVKRHPEKSEVYTIPSSIMGSRKLMSLDKLVWSLICSFDASVLISLKHMASTYTHEKHGALSQAAIRLEEANFLYREDNDIGTKTFHLFDNEEYCIAFKKERESEMGLKDEKI